MSTEPTEQFGDESIASAEIAASTPATEPAPAATINPDYIGAIEPGTIADLEKFAAAVARGDIIELSPEDTAAIDVSHHIELHDAKERAQAAQGEIAKLRSLLSASRLEEEALRAALARRVAPSSDISQAAVVATSSPRRIKGDPYSPPRAPAGRHEIDGYNETRDREARTVSQSVMAAISTLGAPTIWGVVLQVVTPVAMKAAAALVKALHPDSPGGKKLTKRELRAIAEDAADDLQDALWGSFRNRITDEDDS